MIFARGLTAGFAVFFISFAVAQESTRHVAGAVLDADTGEPIVGARVQLFGTGRVPLVFTRKDGVFDVAIPVDERPMVQVSAKGYVAESSRALLRCSPCDVTFRLHAKAAFTGRVVAADNAEPVTHVQVDAFPFVSGVLSKRSADHALTDAAGKFSLERLPAGQYFFRFTPAEPIASLNFGDIDDTQSRRFLAQWWPGGDDWEHSSPYAIVAGSDIRLPDFQLKPDARFIVSGTVLPQYCQGDEKFKVTILRGTNGSSSMLRSTVVSCGAEYSFSDLAPGNYQVAMDGGSGHEPVRVDVQVRNVNVRADLPVIAHTAASVLP